MRRFYLTELFANLVGAPVAAAYGGFMIDFSRVPVGSFLVSVLLIMGINQAVLALPSNLIIGRKLRRDLSALRLCNMDEAAKNGLYSFISKLPALQALLILIRMFLCTGSALFLIQAHFSYSLHIMAVFTFALYASVIVGIFVYYFLNRASSAIAEDIVSGLGQESRAALQERKTRLSDALASVPTTVPTVITSLGVLFILLLIRQEPSTLGFFLPRIVASLCMNIVTIVFVLSLSQRFHKQRLEAIEGFLREMTEHGDTSRKIPTDLTDAYSMTAARINQAFDLFRMVLSQLEDASGRLSGTVMSFSSQIRETVAATTQQASAVKEVVGTMENSNQINRQIEEQARSLSGNAQESQVYVDDGFGKVQDTIRKMDEIKTSNMQTLNEIGELTMQISSIGEIIDIINNIANQTRIIAFNAELEASSAGAAGVSFRIVAEEIRRLANSTVDSLVGIKGRITEIQQSSGRLLASSEEGTGKINEGMKLSGDLNDIFMRIRMSAESTSGSADGISRILVEQNEAFDQIFMTLKQIAEGAEQVLASTRISGSEIGKLQTLIDGLKNVLDRFEYEKEIPAT
jgi:methyl-accepting chemotaxis protein